MLVIKETDPDLEWIGWDSGYNPTYNYKGEPLTGIIQEYEDDGVTLALEYEYKNGLRGGIVKSYYPSGMLQSDGSSYGGTSYYGEFKEYFESGKLKSHRMYSNGSILSGKDYDEDGNVIKVYSKHE